MGRPPKKASERKNVQIMVRATAAQKAALQAAAKAKGVDLSTFLLDLGLAALSGNPESH